MGILKDLGLVSTDNISSQTFEELFGTKQFCDIDYDKPTDYVRQYWNAFTKIPQSNNNLGGKVFELIIETLFLREGLMPLFSQAKVAFVPNVDFDILLYRLTEQNERIPISISIKTSLRERYKQADLEGFALKNVHRKAKCFLLTMNHEEARNVNRKIMSGDVAGLDQVIVCDTDDFNIFMEALKDNNYVESDTRKIITSTFEVTEEKYHRIINEYINK